MDKIEEIHFVNVQLHQAHACVITVMTALQNQNADNDSEIAITLRTGAADRILRAAELLARVTGQKPDWLATDEEPARSATSSGRAEPSAA